MDCRTAKCYRCDQDSHHCPQGHIPCALTNWANSPPAKNQKMKNKEKTKMNKKKTKNKKKQEEERTITKTRHKKKLFSDTWWLLAVSWITPDVTAEVTLEAALAASHAPGVGQLETGKAGDKWKIERHLIVFVPEGQHGLLQYYFI